MSKFRIGQIVIYISGDWGDTIFNPLWGGNCGKIKGKINKIIKYTWSCHPLSKWDLGIKVEWENGRRNSYRVEDLELIGISNPNCSNIILAE